VQQELLGGVEVGPSLAKLQIGSSTHSKP